MGAWPRWRERVASLGRGDGLAAVLIVLVFAASRVAAALAGVRFDASPLPLYWQYLDVELLRGDLLRSLLYLHSQPPLFNLYLGVVLKLAPGAAVPAFAASYHLLGLALALGLYALLRRLGAGRPLGVGLVLLFALSPACILYESHLFYTYPVAAGLVLAALCLHRFLSSGRTWELLGFAALVAGVALTRSLFHLAWVVAALALVALARPHELRRVALVAALPVLLVVLVYAKNQAVFGVFGASSWAGMSFAKLTVFPFYPEERARLVEAGVFSPLARIDPFSPPERYAGRFDLAAGVGLPALDRVRKSTGHPNFNHLIYADLGPAYGRDARTALARRPEVYLRSILAALGFYFRPANEYEFLADNRAAIRSWDAAWATLYYGVPGFREDYPALQAGYPLVWYLRQLGRASPSLVAIHVLALAYGLVVAVRSARQRRLSADAATLLFLAGTLAWVTLVGNLVEVKENNRFRFGVEPLALALLASAWAEYRMRGARRTDAASPSPGGSSRAAEDLPCSEPFSG